jgi:hypothetical protein
MEMFSRIYEFLLVFFYELLSSVNEI